MHRHHRPLLVAAILALSLAACDDDPTSSSDTPSWIDPQIAPRVVATYPLDGGTGPFELFVPGSYLSPHFIVQMNKAINRFEFAPDWFLVEGFDRPVVVYLLQSFDFPERGPMTAADPLVGVLACGVYDNLGFAGTARYRIGRTYTVTVQTTLEDVTGRHPDQPYRFAFQPEPYFRVTSVDPKNGDQQVHPSAYLSVRFNSFVDSTIFASLQLSPPNQGHWTIAQYDSTHVSFVHAEPFSFGTTYTLQVQQTATDMDGNALRQDLATSFRTLPFSVVSNEPTNGVAGVRPSTDIVVITSGSMDPSTAAAAFDITPPVAGILNVESTRLSFTPNFPLALDTRYTVTIGTALRATDGTSLAAPHSFSFTTDRLRIFTFPYDGASEVTRNLVISVECNAPVTLTSAAAAFSITPAVAGTIEPSSIGFGFFFRPQTLLDPNRLYSVTISTALQTSNGEFLSAPHAFAFRTGGI